MSPVFADTTFWIALLNPKDLLHQKARRISEEQSGRTIVTSEMVLVEVFAAFSKYGPHVRAAVVELERELRRDPSVDFVPQTRVQFREACQLYHQRLDKSWSLVDCASFCLMTQRRMQDALTNDVHFVQAGFRALLRD